MLSSASLSNRGRSGQAEKLHDINAMSNIIPFHIYRPLLIWQVAVVTSNIFRLTLKHELVFNFNKQHMSQFRVFGAGVSI